MREFEISDTLLEAAEVLEEIQRPIDSEIELLFFKKNPEKVLKKVLLASQIIKTTGSTGKAIMQISSSIRTFNNIAPTESLKQGLGIGAIIFAALDFLLIPFIYLTCYLLGEKIPADRSNNSKWLFSSILLALTITSITVPAVAIAIALTTTSISFLLSVFLLGRAIYERYRLGNDRRAIRKLIDNTTEEIKSIQTDAITLRNALREEIDEQELIFLCEQISMLHERFKAEKDELIKLKLKELDLNNKIKNAGFMQVMDKGVGLSLSALGLIGLIVSLYFPLVGLGILTAVSVISLAYLAGRLIVPLIQLGKWIVNKICSLVGGSTDDLTQADKPNKEYSTDLMLGRFSANKKDINVSSQKITKDTSDISLSRTIPLFQPLKSSVDRVEKGKPIHSLLTPPIESTFH
ncbi:hypothetical protein [Legionella sp. PC997]|uniref:hypothetical protein n=1 Tax=Legionella sp. PC997 TaxID=2755562 RepID=UPI0015FBDEE3|nr:hypothetical protein [Legionella sp. PC997]